MFMHMFGPMKYVHMRRSGLIAFGGGDSGPSASEITSSVMASASPRFNTLDSGQANIRSDISGVAGQVTGLGSNLENARGDITNNFTNLNKYLADQFGAAGDQRVQSFSALGKSLVDLNSLNQGRADALQSSVGNVGADVISGFNTTQNAMDQGFADATQRFNNLDTSVGDVQDSVNTGFDTAANTLTNFQNDVSGRFDTTDTAFTNLGAATEEGFGRVQTDMTNNQANVLTGQTALADQLNDLSTTQNTYYEDLAANQQAMQENQGNYASSFDNYLTRYGEDTTLQNQALGDIQSGMANLDGTLGGTLEGLSSNLSDTANTLSGAISNTNDSVANILNGGFADVASTIEGGFQQAGTAQDTLASDLGNLRSLMESGNQNISSELASSMQQVSSAFDQQGNLITSGFDDQGNQISRAFDAQGNLITTTTDANGQEIGRVSTNVQDVLSQTRTLGQTLQTGFGGVEAANRGLMSEMGSAGQSLTNIGDLLTRGFGQTQNSLNNIGADTSSFVSNMPSYLRSMAQMSNIPTEMRQQFYQLGNSFDKQGNLISNSIDAQGNTLSRSMDSMGNVIIQKFDPLGQALGNMRISLSDTYNKLNNMGTLPGASAGMGNLSPAMQDLGQGVSASGFGSPYYMTQ